MRQIRLLITSMLGFGPLAAQASLIAFDDAWSALGQSGDPGSFYVESDGATISGIYTGLIGGNGNGDPGNWNLEGINGSAFLGCNSGDSCSPMINGARFRVQKIKNFQRIYLMTTR